MGAWSPASSLSPGSGTGIFVEGRGPAQSESGSEVALLCDRGPVPALYEPCGPSGNGDKVLPRPLPQGC